MKRQLPEDDDIEIQEGPAPKRARITEPESAKRKTTEPGSPSKRRKLEEDGLVIVETPDEVMEDDIIVLD